MTEESNISDIFGNSGNLNEKELNQETVDEKGLNKKKLILKVICCIIMFILIISEVFISYFGAMKYKMKSDSDMSFLIFYILTPFTLIFSIIIFVFTCFDYYPLTKIIINCILFIIKEFLLICLIKALVYPFYFSLGAIISSVIFIIIAIGYQIFLKRTKKYIY